MNAKRHARHDAGARDEPARPSRRQLHHTRSFWVALVLMLLAITIYVLSGDLAWQPRIGG
ncbi:MAG: hypothetical protein L0Y50_10275 [Beijerinckiaceae bacterium]|nr:hypothetical protein [Beijerinckiaceae bacterium]MCI0736638.1 hypothetical protein [Beijerinckiaceae bacterium]